MTIDEAIAIMKSAFKECIEHDTELNVVDANVDILNALEELKWWRNQDLISKSDAISWLCRDCEDCMFNCSNCETTISLGYLKWEIERMLKAEYQENRND